MAADTADVSVVAETRRGPFGLAARTAWLELGTLPLLAGIVCLSFLARLVAGWYRTVPGIFPDEYLYAELGRSLAESAEPLVRGGAAHFPALLHPLLTAPAWLAGDVETAYRLVQGFGALTMSLAAVPAFLLAREAGIGRGLAVGVAALAVAVPDLLYSSFVLAEPIAYPLALGAVLAAVRAIARPGRRVGLAFLLLAGLAALARAQFAVLPLCFLAAVAVVGLRERRLGGALREQALPIGLLVAGAGALAILGPAGALGVYHGVLELRPAPLELAHAFANEAMVLAYASGWVLVPGAILGLAAALRRPRTRQESAFAAVAVLVTGALLLEAALYGDPSRVHERYTFYVAPILAVAFALYASRGWPARVPHALLALGLLTVSAAVPLSRLFLGGGRDNSVFLDAAYELSVRLGSPVAGSLWIAAAAAGLALLAALAALRPRAGTPLVLGVAMLIGVGVWGTAAARDLQNGARMEAVLPDNLSWVDDSGLERAAFLQGPAGDKGSVYQLLFWNRSVDRVLLLPDAAPFDSYASERVRVAADGALLADGRPVGVPLVVDTSVSAVQLRGARLVDRAPMQQLWAPAGTPRLALQLVGRYWDGWLATRGFVNVWPGDGERVAGRLRFRVTTPSEAVAGTLRVFGPAGGDHEFALEPGRSTEVSIPICFPGPWRGALAVDGPVAVLPGRAVTVRATDPVFEPGAAACRTADSGLPA